MNTESLQLSLWLAFWTSIVLLPVCIYLSRIVSYYPFRGKTIVLTFITLPLVLPPTVLGFYLLHLFSGESIIGSLYESLFNDSLIFSFQALLLASIIFNLPFAFQPMQNAFSSIPKEIREAAWCCGLSDWKTFLHIELPLAWPGILSALILTFAHTLGEFGVVLMVGGNIPGETKTIAIEIYDKVQMFDDHGAGVLSIILLSISFTAICFIYILNNRLYKQYD